MTKHLSTLQSLPNEIFIDLYEYFDAQELFQSFYNLNSRFNFLLRSLSNLSIHFRSSNTNSLNHKMIFSSQIHTLNIYSQHNIKLNQFFNLRSLIIWFPTDEQILQINTESFPYIEYLCVSFTAAKPSICSLYQKIFSNGFPSLKSCYLCGHQSVIDTTRWSQSPNLQYLHTSSTDSSILNACPKLYSLILDLPTFEDIPTRFKPHYNLKRLELILASITWSNDENHLKILFSSLPNIERFCFHKTFSITNSIDILLNYDWLSTVLTRCLPLLKRFTYYLYIFNLLSLDRTDFDEYLPKIKENFSKIYKNQSDFSLKIE